MSFWIALNEALDEGGKKGNPGDQEGIALKVR
jgi:hypothetical protein